MNSSTGRAPNTQSRVAAAVMTAHMTSEAATERRTPSSSCAPKRWAVMTANPQVSPKKKPKTRNMIDPEEPPTAASAL